MRQQSRDFTNAAAYMIRRAELYAIARENEGDPWFQAQVTARLNSRSSFGWYPDLDEFGMLSINPEQVLVRADDPDAERKAWLMAVSVYQSGNYRHVS